MLYLHVCVCGYTDSRASVCGRRKGGRLLGILADVVPMKKLDRRIETDASQSRKTERDSCALLTSRRVFCYRSLQAEDSKEKPMKKKKWKKTA